jgi:uncharacterized membrane protein YkvA (DUF1232 family)
MATMKRKKTQPQRSPKARAANPGRATVARPILELDDVRRILLDGAVQLAPADLTTLLGHEGDLRARAAELEAPALSLFRDQLNLALDCLRDHAAGSCPQIPYYTVAILAVAVLYFADPVDVIPDFLPRIGQLDDAAVMAMACQLAVDGLRRYCTWKGRWPAPIEESPKP